MSRLSSPDELWAAFRSNPLLACASIQGIPAVRGHLHRSISASRPERVLILGFDGIPYSIMSRIATDFQELDLIPFLSTVPSTSATAWTSLLTGRKPADHGIYGAAIYLPSLLDSVFLFRPILVRDGVESGVPLSLHHLMPNAPDNWFNDLRGMGFACHALGFPEDLLRNGLIELWLRGAVITRLDDAYSLFDQPAALGSRIWGQTLALLQQPKVAIFAYFNFDWFFHDHGMTAELEAALRCVLEAAVGYWRENPKTFVAALSDHGMRRQEACSFSLLRDPELLALSAHCPGGAGRILYFYARPGAAQELRSKIVERIGTEAEVLNRCEFLERYHGGVCFEPERVGDVVVIASGARFPGAMPAALYEHGGPSREEIMSFVGIVGKSSGAGLSFS